MRRVVGITILTVLTLALTAAAISRVVLSGDQGLLGVSEAFDRSVEQGCTNNLGPVPVRNTIGNVATTTVIELPGVAALATRGETVYLGMLDGRIFRWSQGPSRDLVADLSDDTAVKSDQGLLNMAVTPDGQALLVLRTSTNGDLVLTSHPIGKDGTLAEDQAVLYRLRQPDPRHNGGGLAFGPNGDLFVGIGDGGGQGDPAGAASDPSNPLGSILRAVIDREAGALVPSPRNPRNEDGRHELVWASGVRNPFRIWFDQADRLWISDVGERCREEVTVLELSEAGADLGWSAFEGTAEFDTARVAGRSPVGPTVEYTHENGACAVIGGTEYSGDIIELRGSQIIADLCTATLLAITDGELTQLPVSLNRPVGIGIGPDGQLWVIDIEVGVVRVSAGPEK